MLATYARMMTNPAKAPAAEQDLARNLDEAGVVRLDAPAGVLFQANVWEGDGADENRAVALGLSRQGFVIQLAPRGVLGGGERWIGAPVQERLERLTRDRVELARSALYQTGSPDEWHLDFYGGCRIGRTAFGANRLPNGWAARCNEMDEVWVPNQFCSESFAASGVKEQKLRVMHTGVDTQTFRPGLPALNFSCERRFRFLSITDLRPRRGTDLLLRAYLEEFAADEDVALVLRICERSDARVPAIADLGFFIETELGLRLEDTAELIVLDGPICLEDFPRLYASADAFVAVSRATAYGRNMLEALACEVPVIATRWGGPLEFLHTGNSFLVDNEGLVMASEEEELFAGLQWAQPSVEHLRRVMRQLVSGQEQGPMRARQGRQDAVERWDWNVVLPEWARAFGSLLPLERNPHKCRRGSV